MGPYASPPFLGPLHAVLRIDYKQFATLPAGQQTYAVSLPALPLQARLAGVTLGERFVGFSEPTPTTWTATVSLGSKQLLTSGVGVSNPAVSPLPAGQLPAHVYFGERIGNQTLQLSIALLGPAQPATVTGTVSLTASIAEGLAGKTLVISTDDRGPLTVSFVSHPVTGPVPPHPTPPGPQVLDVLDAILSVTNSDPAVSLDAGSHLVLQSGRTAFSSTLTVVGGTALTALGLSTGTAAGTPSTPATVTGTQDLSTGITYDPATGTLNGLTLIIKTDDRGPFTVTFGTGASAPTGASDVVNAIAAATNTDPAVSLNGSYQLVFTSESAGSAAFLKFSGSAALDLGLPHGRVDGTDGVAPPAPAIVGTVPLGSLTYGSGGSLNLQPLTLTTDRGTFSLTFGTPSGPGDVLAAIQDVTNVDPAASLTNPLDQLVLTSGNAGLTASVTILGGTALAALGFSPGVTYGTVSGTTPAKATVTGTVSLTPAAAALLAGLSLSFRTDDRGPFTVTFGTPASATDVLAAVTASTNTDPAVSTDAGGHLVLQSQGTGTAATMTVGGAAAITLGLTTTATPTVTVTAPGLSTATAGEIDAHLFYFVDRG